MINNNLRTAYEPCHACSGSGLQKDLNGVDDCWECEGNLMVRIRDDKGRFATKEVKLSNG